MNSDPESFEGKLAQGSTSRSFTRREFLKFCGVMAAMLALPTKEIEQIAHALSTAPRPPLVWLEFQDCAGDTESFLRTSQPSVDDLLLETISLDYHETIMAPAGENAEKSREDTVQNYSGQYICLVEGSIPIADGGVYCTIGGQTALSIAQEVCGNAMATIAVGSCAWDGGLAAAAPNPTGAVGVKDAVPGLSPLINMPGCPLNVANLTALLVYFLTYSKWPRIDSLGRPMFAYRKKIHSSCERQGFNENNQFVYAWGDEVHRQGGCLMKMGCQGPETCHNCSSQLWNDGTSWPVRSGHFCIGCAEPNFWDQNAPFYKR